jgi:hypothetical protein
VGEVRVVGLVEGVAEDVLLDAAWCDHLLGGVDGHSHIEEVRVQERYSRFQSYRENDEVRRKSIEGESVRNKERKRREREGERMREKE